MFESLIGSIGAIPEGSTSFSYFTDSLYNGPENDNELLQENEPELERIDLDDEILFLVNIDYEDHEFSVKVDARTMTITRGMARKVIKVDLDFDVDIKNSSVSSRNGIMEITLKKGTKESSRMREGYLKIK
jgi:HSP20 family molecular chaperone IbpA